MQLFAQSHIGMNIAYPAPRQRLVSNGDVWITIWPVAPMSRDTFSFRNGFYARLGGGVIFNPKSKIRVSLNAGWSYKSMSSGSYEWVHNGSTAGFEPYTNTYRMTRMYCGFGVSW